jgi:flagellar protein FlaG
MAIQSLGSAAPSRPPLPERTASGSAETTVASRQSSSQAAAFNGSQGIGEVQSSTLNTANAVKRPDDTPSLSQVNEAVQNINKTLRTLNQDLEFSVDSDSKRTVIRVVDQKTKEVIQQIPSKEALEIAKALDTVKGLLVKQQA